MTYPSLERFGGEARVSPRWRVLGMLCLFPVASLLASAQSPVRTAKTFDIPSADAVVTLKQFAAQSGEQLLYSPKDVAGLGTREVRGVLTAREALERLVAGTPLVVTEDASTGALALRRVSSESAPSGAPTPTPAPEAGGAKKPMAVPMSDETVTLSEFTVSSDRPDRYRTAETTSAMRVRGPLIETPSSISIMSRELIDDITPGRLYDVMRFAAGVTEGRGTQFSDRVIIRGFENDGRTVDSFALGATSNLDEAVVDRIEVIKGPNTILAPTGTPGGSVNVVTKTPEFQRSGSISALAGLYDAQKLTLDATGPLRENLAYRVTGVVQDTDLYWTDTTLRRQTLFPQLRYRLNDRTDIVLKYLYSYYSSWGDPRQFIDPSVVNNAEGKIAPGWTRKGTNGLEPGNERASRFSDLKLVATSRLSDHVSMRLSALWNYIHDWSYFTQLAFPGTTTRYNPLTGALTPDYIWTSNTTTGTATSTYSPYYDPTSIPRSAQRTLGYAENGSVQNDYSVKFEAETFTSDTIVGGTLNTSHSNGSSRNGSLPNINIFAPVYGASPTWASSYATLTSAKSATKQLYAVEKLQFFDRRLTLIGGASRLWVDNVTTNLLAASTASVPLNDNHDSFLGGALFKVLPRTSLYYSYSSNSNPTTANNAPLWRDGVQHEFGVKSEFFDQRLSLTAAHFEISQTNVVVPNPEYQLDKTKPQSIISDFKNHGYELEVNGGITRSLSLIASGQWLHVRDSLGRRPRAIADKQFSLLLNYRFLGGSLKGLAVSFGASHTGSSEGDAPPSFTALGVVAQPSFLVPAYTTCVAGASYTWGKVSFRLAIDNVFDSDHLYSPGARFAVGQAPGTNVKLTTTYKF